MASGRPIFVIILAIPRHQVGLSLARQSSSSIGLDTPLNTPSTSDFALARKPSPLNHDRGEISQTPAKAKPQRKTLKHQNPRERRTPANGQKQPGEHELGFSAKRPIFGGIAGVPQLTHDPTIRASEVLSCTFSIQMVGKIQTKFTTLAQQISYQSWNPLRKTSLPRPNSNLQFSNDSTRKYQCIVPPFLWA